MTETKKANIEHAFAVINTALVIMQMFSKDKEPSDQMKEIIRLRDDAIDKLDLYPHRIKPYREIVELMYMVKHGMVDSK